jgi:hypothetical protein
VLKSVLTSSGVDTSVFSAHSTRGASTSGASQAGVTTQQILSTADWSTARSSISEIGRFSLLARVLISLYCQLQSHVVIRSLNLLICNCRMAKHIQCVQAIQNCMKKVKAEYHNVPPLRPSVVPIPRNLSQILLSCIVIAIIIYNNADYLLKLL